MRLLCVSLQANELPTAEQWGRHACALFDRVIVADSGSADGTRQVYELLRGEGLPIECIDWQRYTLPEQNWKGHDKVLRHCIEIALATGPEPDFIDCSDGDEWPMFTHDSLREKLEAAPRGVAPSKKIATFVPTPDGFRRRLHDANQSKSFIPWRHGRCWPHISAHRAITESGAVMPHHEIGHYAHVPVRNAEQALVKQVQAVSTRDPCHMRAIKHDPALIDIANMALKYYGCGAEDLDPDSRVPFDGMAIKYPEYQQTNALRALAGLAGVELEAVRAEHGEAELYDRLAEMAYERFWTTMDQKHPGWRTA
jgi:hypothetical protein